MRPLARFLVGIFKSDHTRHSYPQHVTYKYTVAILVQDPAWLCKMPPSESPSSSHERPHFVAEAQPDQPLPVAQLPDEAVPLCQNGLVLVRPPCPRFIARLVEDRYQAILARWRRFCWWLRHERWLALLRCCYAQRPYMARWGHMAERRRQREERRRQLEEWWYRWQ